MNFFSVLGPSNYIPGRAFSPASRTRVVVSVILTKTPVTQTQWKKMVTRNVVPARNYSE